MKIGRNMIVAIMITFCFTASIFMIIPIRSANSPYDPWIDYNDDGKISLQDLVSLANSYGTTGDPINKTELLIQVNATYAGLLSEIDSLNSSLLNLQAYLNMSIARIAELETEIAVLNATKLGQPDFDSGYVQINQSESIILTHNLGTTDVLVYMVGDVPNSVPYIHQHDYGGEVNTVYYYGAFWSELTTTTIKITRNGNDANWPYIRVMIWKVYKNQGP